MKLFDELKRRNVFRVAGVYAVVGWLLIQVIVAVLPTLGAPPWVAKVFIVLVAAGFPLALVLAWAFELTPEGVKLTANVPEGESIAPNTGRKLDYAILGGLALVGAMFVYGRVNPRPASFETAASQPPQDEGLAASLPHPEEDGAPATSVSKDAKDASIAVLPFADLSPGKDQEYFADGVSEEILNVLAKADGLDVASRTSSFAFKGQGTLGIPAIAKELRVRHVLEGSVRKAGNTLRITAQLIDAENDRHLWSETYDRPLTAENVFAVQDEIAQAIVAALSGVMKTGGDPAPAAVKATSDLSAYDLYLKARDFYQRRENLDAAEALLAEAVTRDPEFADAWALRAANMSLFKEYLPTDRTYAEYGALVDDYVDRALRLDPDNARAIAARANFRLTAGWGVALKFDLGGVFSDLERAVALDPRDSSAVNWLGMASALIGDIDRALEIFKACADFDPYFGPCAENYYDLLVVAGRFDEALKQYENVLAKGIVVSGWANFELLAHFNDKAGFMQATNHPSWLPGWRGHEDLYDAFKNPEKDHGALIADLQAYIRSRPQRGVNPYSLFLIPIGDFDATPYPITLWAGSYASYRRSPQFKTYIRESGVYDYWRAHGFPPQCRPVGPQNSETADFECE